MFDAAMREDLRAYLVEKAQADPQIVAAAAVGGSAEGSDRWSDLDLTFGVAEGVPIEDVLADWTEAMRANFNAAVLFDLPRGTSIYRVFLLPGMLQVDLSFTPGPDFGARGPRFQLLFGEAIEHPTPAPEPSEHLFGLAIHHLVRATICVERGRFWQAEYWIHEARDVALTLACRRLDLSESEGRGFDHLPPEIRDELARSLVGSLTMDELRRAVRVVLGVLLQEASDIPEVTQVRPIMEEIIQARSAVRG